MKAASISTVRSRAPRGVAPALAALIGALALLSFSAAHASAATPNFCPPGSAAAQCNSPQGVAVDNSTGAPTSGDVYIADGNNNRVDVFDSSGNFLRAFGVGVINGENVLQTCTASCIAGRQGSAPGEFDLPPGVAVDPTTHDVYVSDANNFRVEKFTPEGQFLLSFGSPGTGPGQFDPNPSVGAYAPLAIDPATGEVLVGDNERVERFGAAGEFLSETSLPGARTITSLALDGSSGDLYTINPPQSEIQRIDPPGSGTYALTFEGQTTAPLAFDASDAQITVALEALSTIGSGNVVVISRPGEAHLVAFQGALKDKDLPPLGTSAGSIVTRFNGGPGALLEFEADGTFLAALDPAGHPDALTLDPDTGELFVGECERAGAENGFDKSCSTPYSLLTFDPAGTQTAAFGTGEVLGGPAGNALAFAEATGRLYTVSSQGGGESAAQAFAVPPPGPLPESGTTKATPIGKLGASLCAKVNPEGAATTAHFQYITAAAYKEDGESFGPGTEVTAESASLGSDFEGHEICLPVSALQPATAYRFRVVATNANGPSGGTLGEAAEFSTLPPAAIDSTGVTAVTADSATLLAEIDPLGEETFYRFEFLTEAAYLHNQAEGLPPFTGAALAPPVDADLGAGNADVAVSQHLQGLQSATAYRYRVLLHNATSEAHGGPFAGPTRAFTTQSVLTATLLDGRAWELVSPPEKRGASLEPIAETGLIQAAASGDAISYLATAPTEAGPQGNSNKTQVLSARGPGGWSSIDLSAPHGAVTGATTGTGQEYHFFSQDLTLGLLQPVGPFEPSLSPEASEQTPFIHTNFPAAEPTAFCAGSCYRPVVTGTAGVADVPPGTEFGEDRECTPEHLREGQGFICGPQFISATPDLSHAIVASGVALTQAPLPALAAGLYEFSAAAAPPVELLRLISVLPAGEPVGAGGSSTLGSRQNARNAISADGSRVVFSTSDGHLYLRLNATAEPTASGECSAAEPGLACTIELDQVQAGAPGGSQAPAAGFQIAAADTSRIFFTDTQQLTPGSGAASHGGGDLYEYDLEKPAGERLTDLTPPGAGGEPAGVLGLLPGASADGSYLYFVADGVLSGAEEDAAGEEAAPGGCKNGDNSPISADTCNLYLRHDGATSLVAVLSASDQPDWGGHGALRTLTARVSPDGRRLAFMSQRELTGYDNHDASSGEPDQEVYLYHAGASTIAEGSLVCASCDPTGARPHGVENETGNAGPNLPLAADTPVWGSTWLAANVPGWTPYSVDQALYQSRYLSDSGRLFFNSSDALVPADSNGTEDVYEYEPPGVGDCTTSSPTFGSASEGCVGLVSSGTSPEESAFLDASESGDDVFFLTSARLSRRDPDSSLDVYDARVGGGEAEATPPVECSGDGCQQPAVPPADQTPGSLTFSGAGNVLECPKGKVVKSGKCVKRQQGKKHKKGKKHGKAKSHHKAKKSGKHGAGK